MVNRTINQTFQKLTIITVSYNSLNALKQTVENVMDSPMRENINFIVIDGGSTDGTVNFLNQIGHNLSYWVSEPDSGIYDAMNKGWRRADDNSFILFLGCGDKILNWPDLDRLNAAEIIVGTVLVDDKFLYVPKVDIRLKLGNTLHHQALMVKKSIHKAPPFDINYKTYADFDFNQRLFKSGHKITIDKNFKGYAMGGGVSAQFNKRESLEIVNKNFGVFYMLLAKIYYLLRHEIK